jgi:alkaline phosphatase D
VILDVNTNRTQADWYYVNTIDNQSTSFNYAKSYYVNNFQRHLIYNNAASLPRNSIYSTLAPVCPRNSVPTNVAFSRKETVIISVYPNPAYDFITLQFQNYSNTHSTLKITDVSGKNVYEEKITGTIGVMKHYLNTANLEKGIYFITIVSDNNSETFKFIKH